MNKKSQFYKNWKKIKKIKQIFNLFGHENIFLVGGAVRNYLLQEPFRDIDLAVKLDVNSVKEELAKAKIQFADLSKGHGTVTIINNFNTIEITSMRIDEETYGRKAKVKFVSDIYRDSCRRDFTINSIYSNFNGKIYDPHNGKNDLLNSMVKFIGVPLKRIQEDNLRVLRYYRFLSYYGCNSKVLDKESLFACKKAFNVVSNISKERKSHEFFKLINGKHASDVIILMKKQKILKYIVPGLEKVKNKDLKRFDNLNNDKLLRICFFLMLTNLEPFAFRQHLHFNKKEFLFLIKFYKNFKHFRVNNNKNARLIKYKLGKSLSIGIYYLTCFLEKKNMNKNISNIFEKWKAPEFPINGNDLKKSGINPDKSMGFILKKTRDWWEEKDFKPNRKQCLRKSRKIIINSKEL